MSCQSAAAVVSSIPRACHQCSHLNLRLQSGFLAIVSAQLLATIKTISFDNSHSNSVKFLLLLSYSGLALSCSATISSLILVDKLGELPIRASRMRELDNVESIDGETISILRRYGAGESWELVMWHCEPSAAFACTRTQWCIFSSTNRAHLSSSSHLVYSASNLDVCLDTGDKSSSRDGGIRSRVCPITIAQLHFFGT